MEKALLSSFYNETTLDYYPSLIKASPLHLAAVKGDFASLQQLVSEFPRCIGALDDLGRNALMYAILGDQIKCLKLLLKCGIDVNQADESGRTALHWATLKNHVQCVKYLLSYGGSKCNVQDKEGVSVLHLASKQSSSECLALILKHLSPKEIDAQDNDKRTALHWSACCAHSENVRLLVSRTNLSIGIRDIEGKTALHWAASSSGEEAVECIRILLSHVNGAAVLNLHDLEGRTALHCAVIDRAVSSVRELVSLPTCNVDPMDNCNCTPLHWATILEQEEVVGLLLDRKASTSIHDVDGATPLHYAAQNNSLEIVQIYMLKMCNADQSDHNRCTPLMWAASKAANDVVMLLCRFGANLRATDDHGFTALHVAALSGHSSTVRTLLDHGASVNAVDALGRTALFHACEMGHISAIQALLDGGSVLNIVDHNGRSCLHWAVINGHVDVCRFLIEHGCDPNASDYEGRPSLLHATFHNQIDCMSHLLERGVHPGVSDREGWTALHWACHRGYLDAVKLLLDYNVNKNRMISSGDRFTPLDLAIISYHYEVATFLLKRDCVSITHIKEMAASIIQAVYRGYKIRKFCKAYKVKDQKLVVHNEFSEEIMCNTLRGKAASSVDKETSVDEIAVNCQKSCVLNVSCVNSPVRRLSCSDENLFDECTADDMFKYLSVSHHTGAIRLNRKKFLNSSSDLAVMSKNTETHNQEGNVNIEIGKYGSSRRRLKSSGDVLNCVPKEINSSRSLLRLNDLGNFKRGFLNPFRKKASSAIDLGLGHESALNCSLEDEELKTNIAESENLEYEVVGKEKLDKTVQFEEDVQPAQNIPSWCYDATLRKAAEKEWLETLANITIERVPLKSLKPQKSEYSQQKHWPNL